jgi:hypothetical protein
MAARRRERVNEDNHHRDLIWHTEASVEGSHGALDDAHAAGQQGGFAQQQRQSIARHQDRRADPVTSRDEDKV